MGSPIGAYFTIVTSTPWISPISKKCCLNAPVPPTETITALFPIAKLSNFIFYPFSFFIRVTLNNKKSNKIYNVYPFFLHNYSIL